MLTGALSVRPLLSRVAFLVATFLLVTLAAPMVHAPSAVASTGELLINSDFTQGTTGWRTNGTNQRLAVLTGPPRTAQLTTTTTGNVVLNDAKNSATKVASGTTFTATARVRSTTPTVTGALRVREVAGAQVKSHQSSFRIGSTAAQTVTLTFTTTHPGAELDVNVVGWNLTRSQNLRIEWVSLKRSAAPAPAPAPPQQQCKAAPPSGTKVGVSLSTVGQTLHQSLGGVDSIFGRVPVVRHFSPGLPFSWNSSSASTLKGRTLVLSFKVHPSQINNGSQDAFLRNWFKTAPTDQIIYWSYYHEPENNINRGEFTSEEYRRAWQRVSRIAAEACKPNLFATLILTEWTMNPGSKRDYRTYDAGKDYVDVIAFDPYNAVYNPKSTTYIPADKLLGDIATKMRADGRPWGIAELGSRVVVGDNGTGRATWLASIASYARANNARFVTYFHDIGPNGDWRLRDRVSQQAWAQQVAR